MKISSTISLMTVSLRPSVWFLFSAILCFLTPGGLAQAAGLSLSVSTDDGGSVIQFGRAGLTSSFDKEVRVRVNQSENKPYQVFVRLQEGFVNELGRSLTKPVLLMTGVGGSNSSGSLLLQQLAPVSFHDELIYSSDSPGTSDSFLMNFHVDDQALEGSGEFRGTLVFTVRPVGEGAIAEKVITVFLDAGKTWTVEGRSRRGGQTIRLKSRRPDEREDAYELSFQGHSSGELKIYVEVLSFPANEENRFLEEGDIEFWTSSGIRGRTFYTGATPLERSRYRLYETEADEDGLAVHFRLNESRLKTMRAGQYSGRIRFSVETPYDTRIFDVSLWVEIEPVFQLEVMYPPEGMSFERLLPQEPPQTRDVRIKVHTNLGRPYSVVQNRLAPMTNEAGDELAADAFTFKEVLEAGVTGRVLHPDFQPVPQGEATLFLSDPQGQASDFHVIYRLKAYPGVKPGQYTTSLMYSLNEL